MSFDPATRLTEPKDVAWPQLVALAVCFLGVLACVWTFVVKGQKNTIFPREEERFDVTTLKVAPLASVCPEAAQMGSESLLASCAQKLDQASSDFRLKPLKIQSLSEQAINFHPRFQDLLEEQGLSEARDALLKGETLVLGATLPRHLFKSNAIGTRPNTIVFASAGDARLCYLGACPHATLPGEIPALKFPLFAPDTVKGSQVALWIFAKTKDSPLGLNLQHGLFVADPAAMRPVERIHIPLINSSDLLASVLLLGIVIMALLYATLWFDYIDFVAFAALATAQFVAAVTPVLFMLETSWSQHQSLRIGLSIGSELNVAIAALFFAIATLRPSSRRFWSAWGVAVTLVIAIALVLGQIDLTSLTRRWIYFSTATFGCIVPGLFAFGGGIWMSKFMRQEWFGPGLKPGADAKRRFQEQSLLALGLVIAGLPVFIRRTINMYGYWTYDISALRSVGMFPLFAILLYAANSKFRTRAESYRKDLIQMARQAATFEMVQMLAHDVRKPFSLLKMGLDLLARAQSYSETRDVLARLSPQVTKALKGVTGMLGDIMTVSSTPTLRPSKCRVRDLIGGCFDELVLARGPLEVNLRYDFKHTVVLDVDLDKIQRVLINILDNAVQAMSGRGNLWIYTRDTLGNENQATRNFVQITIGNSGSYIPVFDRERIFEAFFTKGKKGGTGLGLAVAQKFCTLHGGWVRCFSDPEQGTEFVMQLPSGTESDRELHPELPSSLRGVGVGGADVEATRVESLVEEQAATDLFESVRQAVSLQKKPLRVLIVDDEPLYAAAIQSLVGDAQDVVTFHVHSEPQEALAFALTEVPDLIICDIDLGDPRGDGFELCERLRVAGVRSMICVHSNRSLPEDSAQAISVGANSFLPKPMAREDFALLLTEAAQGALSAWNGRPFHGPSEKRDEKRPLVVVIDDDVFVREAWAEMLQPARVETFARGADFWLWVQESLQDHDKDALLAIVVDWYLLHDEDGITLAQDIRKAFLGERLPSLPRVPVLLCTDSYDMVPQDPAIDHVIPKEPLNLQQLLTKITALQSTQTA